MRNHGLRIEADLPIGSSIRNESALADLFFGIHACDTNEAPGNKSY
jgi:hypothetical protein